MKQKRDDYSVKIQFLNEDGFYKIKSIVIRNILYNDIPKHVKNNYKCATILSTKQH